MVRLDVRLLTAIVAGSLSLGCGGAEKAPAKTPTANEPAQAKAKRAAPANAESAPAADAEPEQEGEADAANEPAKDEGFKPERPPLEFLTDKKLSFETNFVASQIGIETEERCREEHSSDMREFAACKKEVSSRIGSRVLRFNEKSGSWWFLVYSKKDLGKTSQLALLHKVLCKFGEQTDNSITVELVGKDEMKTGEKLPRKLVVTIPNDYSIDIDDPVNGRMNYLAKYGNLPGQGM